MFSKGKQSDCIITSNDFDAACSIVTYFDSCFNILLSTAKKCVSNKLDKDLQKYRKSILMSGKVLTARMMLNGGGGPRVAAAETIFDFLQSEHFGYCQSVGRTFQFIKNPSSDIPAESLEKLQIQKESYDLMFNI
jgi:hypothetical protein